MFESTVPSAVLAVTVPVTVMVALPPAVIVPRLQGKAAQPPCEELTVTAVVRGQCVIDRHGLGVGRSGIADRDVVSERLPGNHRVRCVVLGDREIGRAITAVVSVSVLLLVS